MNEEKQQEVLALIETLITENCNKQALAEQLMLGYIFGTYASSEHYNIDEFRSLIEQKYNELYLPVENNEII